MVQRRFRGTMTRPCQSSGVLRDCSEHLAASGFAVHTWHLRLYGCFVSTRYLVRAADLFGWVTVSFLVAMTSGLIVD